MIRSFRPVLCFAAAAMLVATSNTFAVDRWPAVRVGEGESEKRIRQTLDEPTDINFKDVPLSDVVTYIADFHKIPIVVDKRANSGQAIAPEQIAVNISLTGITLRSALSIMLGELNLDYVIRDEVLFITTPEIAASSAPLCLFDVSSMVSQPEELDLVLATVQSYANRYSTQITMYRHVILVKGNQRQQDDIAAFLAALFRAQAGAQPMPETPIP